MEPEVAPFSGIFNDLEPFLAPDGKRLFFASNRDTNQLSQKKDYDIWYVEKGAKGQWGQPVHLGLPINSSDDEFFPSVAQNGNLYFTAIRETGAGSEDIFVSEYIDGRYGEPEALDSAINSETYEFNAYINPEEDLLIFSSYGRADDLGGGDLYYSIKDKARIWQPAIHFNGKINTQSLDYCPFYDEASGMLYFTSNQGAETKKVSTPSDLSDRVLEISNSYGNIYRVQIKKLLSGG